MVRPIEITDALSKAQEVGRMQQNAQLRPETAQAFQKSLSEKLHTAEVKSTQPTPATDQVVLHPVDEQDKEKRHTPEDQVPEEDRKTPEEDKAPIEEGRALEEETGSEDERDSDEGISGHIDVKA